MAGCEEIAGATGVAAELAFTVALHCNEWVCCYAYPLVQSVAGKTLFFLLSRRNLRPGTWKEKLTWRPFRCGCVCRGGERSNSAETIKSSRSIDLSVDGKFSLRRLIQCIRCEPINLHVT